MGSSLVVVVYDYETASYSFSNYILLFENNITHENFIATNTDNGTKLDWNL